MMKILSIEGRSERSKQSKKTDELKKNSLSSADMDIEKIFKEFEEKLVIGSIVRKCKVSFCSEERSIGMKICQKHIEMGFKEQKICGHLSRNIHSGECKIKDCRNSKHLSCQRCKKKKI